MRVELIPEIRHEGMPLGWHRPKRPDLLHKLFPAPRAKALVSATHAHRWPVLNQGQVGSCTGNDVADCLNTFPLATADNYDESHAVSIYSLATAMDNIPGNYPPTDTGTTNAWAARSAQKLGDLVGWTYCIDWPHFLQALVLQPIMFASIWTETMFHPDKNGQVHPTGSTQGGHSYEADEIDVLLRRVWFQNSWGNGWGVGGRFWMSWANAESLSEPGEMIALHVTSIPGLRMRKRRWRL